MSLIKAALSAFKRNMTVKNTTRKYLFYFLLVFGWSTTQGKRSLDSSRSNSVLVGISKHPISYGIFLQENFTQAKAQVGATGILHCVLSASLADGMVSWVRRKDYHLLTVGRQVYSSDKRFGVKVSHDGSDWMLTIRRVDPYDAGSYECQVSSYPPQSLIIKLRIVKAYAEILGDGERHIHNGSSLRLVCLVRDATEPPVYIFWYRGERMINYDKEIGVGVANSKEASVLFVSAVSSGDQGNYTCVPSNASPTAVTVHVIRRENPAGLQESLKEKESAEPSVKSAAKKGTSGSPTILLSSLLKLINFLVVILNSFKTNNAILVR